MASIPVDVDDGRSCPQFSTTVKILASVKDPIILDDLAKLRAPPETSKVPAASVKDPAIKGSDLAKLRASPKTSKAPVAKRHKPDNSSVPGDSPDMSGVYVVIGARGGTGRQIVRRLAERSPSVVKEIRAFVRNPSKVPSDCWPKDDRIKLCPGDCTDPAGLAKSLTGAEGVFFAAAGRGWEYSQQVDRDGVLATATAAKLAGVRRVLLISSQLVDPANRFHPIRMLLNTVTVGVFHLQGTMDFKHEGEMLLRKSGQEHTIVRPGRLIDGPLNTSTVRVGQTNAWFMRGSMSTRADVAATCVAAMMPGEGDATINTTFEMACDPQPKAGEPVPIFQPLSSSTFKRLQVGHGE
jgi:uncharacterized protein YbjT (DUF2867 family)